LNKNSRWALAIVGAVILIVGAIVIATSKEDSNATQDDTPTVTEPTPETVRPGGPTGSTGGAEKPTTPSDDTGGAAPDDNGGSGDDNGSGGANPDESKSGGAGISSATPVLKSGEIQKITVKKGDEVTIRATAKTADELHVHGYDKEIEIPAGKTVTLRFRANIDGAFPIELHGSDEQIGELVVNP
jgi:hypothetical protein